MAQLLTFEQRKLQWLQAQEKKQVVKQKQTNRVEEEMARIRMVDPSLTSGELHRIALRRLGMLQETT